MSVAVVGPTSFVTCFALIGGEGFDADDGEAVAETLNRLIDEQRFKLIIIPERFAEETQSIRELVMKRGDIHPVFALIPDFTMETGMRMEELQAVVSLAIGTKLEL
jgi:vacuolar-type H+-ATPase subunit F/Vma7